ncbi:Olfactory receptor 10H1 [Camelus dromedarius]|uniref:Olfactory receptor 10H1 n=1 Tax=Camelus dromedarius TaxID=9838 RepID=A0A5N4CMI3_CAMDR|nr:Olfactory receptor 10H1 [Camelus dromedarius]
MFFSFMFGFTHSFLLTVMGYDRYDPSAEGRHKAFSTCASHLTVVVVHYSFASVIYLKPKIPQSLEGDTLMGITYNGPSLPVLSPHHLQSQDKELKNAMKKTFLSMLYPEKM